MAHSNADNGVEQLRKSDDKAAESMKAQSEQEPKKAETYQDVLAYEDKWIGWDGPVWCSRYGRFENQEDASADDGYTVKGQPPHQELGLERCEKHGCSCKVPIQHRSYIQDIQRRVEPMVASLVRLEHQVGSLIHHIIPGEGGTSTHGTNSNKSQYVEGGFAARYDETTHIHHTTKDTSHTNHSQHAIDPLWEKLRTLEARVESLIYQMHGLKNHHGHDISEKKPDVHQDQQS